MSCKTFLFLISLTWLMSCSATYQSRTIGKGNIGAEMNMGGPLLTNLGPALPLPNIYMGGRYGLRDNLDIYGGYNIYAAFMPGIPLDLNTSLIWIPVQPGLSGKETGGIAGAALHIEWITDFSTAFHIVPRTDLYGGWRYRWFSSLAGTSLGANFYRPRKTDSPLLLEPFLAMEFQIRDHLGIMLRITMHDLLYNYYDSQIDWVYVSTNEEEQSYHGVWGVSLGVSWDFIREGADHE